MLTLTKIIGKGVNYLYFEHPTNPDKCVRIGFQSKEKYLLKRELTAFFEVEPYLKEHLVKYEPDLVRTNLGRGLVSDLLKDDDGTVSKPLSSYFPLTDKEIISELWHFSYCLVEHDVFFYDFNPKNFVVQIHQGHKRVFFIDLKGWNRYKPWTFLHAERVIYPLASRLMIRRLNRFFTSCGLK